MKKTLLASSALAIMIGLSSCNLNGDPENNYSTFSFPACDLVIPAVGEQPYIINDTYMVTLYPYSQAISVGSMSLTLDRASAPFTSGLMQYTVKGSNINFSNGTATGNGVTVSNLTGYTTQALYVLPSTEIYNAFPEFPFKPTIQTLVVSYTANHDYRVYTFLPDLLFSGSTTVTSLDPAEASFSSKDTFYRIIFSTDYKTADVLFYQSKFAPNMPGVNFIVRDLQVNITTGGYEITLPDGVDSVIPEMPEGIETVDGKPIYTYTPVDRYRFNRFSLSSNTSDNLTTANGLFGIDFMANGNPVKSYILNFSGSYVVQSEE